VNIVPIGTADLINPAISIGTLVLAGRNRLQSHPSVVLGVVYLGGPRWPFLISGGKRMRRVQAEEYRRLVLLAQSGAEATILTSLTRSRKMIANPTDRYVAIMKRQIAQRGRPAR
jgi:hypothetical protein